jgi:hypothetical protein
MITASESYANWFKKIWNNPVVVQNAPRKLGFTEIPKIILKYFIPRSINPFEELIKQF